MLLVLEVLLSLLMLIVLVLLMLLDELGPLTGDGLSPWVEVCNAADETLSGRPLVRL